MVNMVEELQIWVFYKWLIYHITTISRVYIEWSQKEKNIIMDKQNAFEHTSSTYFSFTSWNFRSFVWKAAVVALPLPRPNCPPPHHPRLLCSSTSAEIVQLYFDSVLVNEARGCSPISSGRSLARWSARGWADTLGIPADSLMAPLCPAIFAG